MIDLAFNHIRDTTNVCISDSPPSSGDVTLSPKRGHELHWTNLLF